MDKPPCGSFSTSPTGKNSSETPTESIVENAAASGVGFTTDSAYNSGHENSPEKQDCSCQDVIVKITEEKLFKKFFDVGNENIVTKSGRRLFPALMVNVQGLEPATPYNAAFRVTSADPFRYRFVNMKWMIVGESEVDQNLDRQISLHPDSPKNGESWMKRPISFKSIKLTHNPKSNSELILLHTMHKYVVEIIFTANPGNETSQEIVVPLKYTTFIAVVAYQNFDLIDLKIVNNPYANCSKEKLQRELEQDSASRLANFSYYNPYQARIQNPRPYMTHPLAPAMNLQMYNPLSAFGVPVPPLTLPGTSILPTSSSIAQNLPTYNPLPSFGAPVPPFPLPMTSIVPTSLSTALNFPTHNPLPTFGVAIPPLGCPGTNTLSTSSLTAPNLPMYNPLPAFGAPAIPGASTVPTSSSTVPNMSIYNPLPAFGVPVPPLPLMGANTLPTSLSTAPNLQMYNPLNLPLPPRPPLYPIPRYPGLYAPFCLNAAPIITQKTEGNTVPPTTQK